ncbi:hypothetical protein KP509_17G048900 [Ceratopteris richardii]|uniref:Uncharacterized protein n=1 Tax=Ceratopteris richardii TaxID=49495 RepID=A0A8T2SWP0_CERRI|nr:hypothetical protein KP509_17G048900 [Ceratopteris richardii]
MGYLRDGVKLDRLQLLWKCPSWYVLCGSFNESKNASTGASSQHHVELPQNITEKPDLETASVRVQLDAETQKRLRLENKVTCVDTALNSMRRLRQGTSKSGRFIRQQLKR